MDIKRLLELSGVDTTKGKAKKLIESNNELLEEGVILDTLINVIKTATTSDAVPLDVQVIANLILFAIFKASTLSGKALIQFVQNALLTRRARNVHYEIDQYIPEAGKQAYAEIKANLENKIKEKDWYQVKILAGGAKRFLDEIKNKQ